MSKYSGKMDGTGRKGPDRRNKGVARMMREVKRTEAEARNAQTLPTRRRSFAKAAGFNRTSELTKARRVFERPNDVDNYYGVDDDQAFALELYDSKD